MAEFLIKADLVDIFEKSHPALS